MSGAFLLAPVLLYPILKITRTYQLSSLADLFAFRFDDFTLEGYDPHPAIRAEVAV